VRTVSVTRTVGILSDTHGWLDPVLLEHFSGVDVIVHAGDVGAESVLDQLRALAPVVAVRGNIDGGALADLPDEATVEVAGRRIAVRHIAGSPTRPNQQTLALIEREQPDVLVVGHSHIAVAGRAHGLLWINPGAAGHEGFHAERTAARIEIGVDGELKVYRLHLGRRGR
jgi:uncharacterized protein